MLQSHSQLFDVNRKREWIVNAAGSIYLLKQNLQKSFNENLNNYGNYKQNTYGYMHFGCSISGCSTKEIQTLEFNNSISVMNIKISDIFIR